MVSASRRSGICPASRNFEPQHLGTVPVPRALTNDGAAVDNLDRLVSEVIEARITGNKSKQRTAEHNIDTLVCRIAGIAFEDLF